MVADYGSLCYGYIENWCYIGFIWGLVMDTWEGVSKVAEGYEKERGNCDGDRDGDGELEIF